MQVIATSIDVKDGAQARAYMPNTPNTPNTPGSRGGYGGAV